MQKKIILNYLNPASIAVPSAALSILKSFITNYGYNVEIKYWNIILRKYANQFNSKDIENDLLQVLPYYIALIEEYEDETAFDRIFSFLYSILPSFVMNKKDFECVKKLLIEQKSEIEEIIEKELSILDKDEILCFGFTSKFYQWIPAIFFAKKIKNKFPDIKIIIGGFENKDSAEELLSISNCFDFAFWGEGEYPFLHFCNTLNENKSDFSHIQRIAYKNNSGEIVLSDIKKNEYLDFDKYIIPDYEDYFNQIEKSKLTGLDVLIPINASRGCTWNQCNFCVLNEGYKYRERNPECILKELDCYINKYSVSKFNFVDNNIIGSSLERFENLLDLLIDYSLSSDVDFEMFSEVIPHNLNAKIIKKMALAGFKKVQMGYEAVTDNLLSKMNKSSNFSDNILAIKFFLKYNIAVNGANILNGIPNEVEEDVSESIKNLYFMRFFLGKEKIIHRCSQFTLYKKSRYYKLMKEDEKEKYDYNIWEYFFPEKMRSRKLGFNLLFYKKKVLNYSEEWDNFWKINNFYESNQFYYKILDHNGVYFYEEYFNENKINSFIFNDMIYWNILEEANDHLVSFDGLYKSISCKHPKSNITEIKEKLNELKKEYLIYFNKDYNNIISVIDVKNVKA